MVENTYTYTARSATSPEKVVTFTLRDHHLFIDLGVPVEQVESTLRSGDEEESQGLWLKPLVTSLAEVGMHPFRVDDVNASMVGDGLRVTAWVRIGLRLLPVIFAIEEVDNPVAAQDFVKELEERREEAGVPPAPLRIADYWFTWIGLVLVAGGFLLWQRKEN